MQFPPAHIISRQEVSSSNKKNVDDGKDTRTKTPAIWRGKNVTFQVFLLFQSSTRKIVVMMRMMVIKSLIFFSGLVYNLELLKKIVRDTNDDDDDEIHTSEYKYTINIIIITKLTVNDSYQSSHRLFLTLSSASTCSPDFGAASISIDSSNFSRSAFSLSGILGFVSGVLAFPPCCFACFSKTET